MIYRKTTKRISRNYTTNKDEITHRIQYYILLENKNGVSIKIEYDEFEKSEMERTLKDALKTGNLLKPKKLTLEDEYSVKSIKNSIKRYNSQDTITWENIDEKPEKIGLYIPAQYKNNDVEQIVERSRDIDDEVFNKMKQIAFSAPFAVIGDNFYDAKNNKESIVKIWCPKCKKIFIPNNDYNKRCPSCNGYFGKNSIADQDFKEYRKSQFNIIKNGWSSMNLNEYSNKTIDRVYYMTPVENGINLYKLTHEVICKKGKYTEKYGIEYSIEHVIGGNMKAYKHLKSGKRECDPFEALGINTKNFNNPPQIIYDGAINFLQFAKQNEKTMRMFGFMEVLKYSPQTLRLDAFFIIFLGIMNRYPVMEQIVKMGHAKLFFELYKKMEESLNRDEIESKVESLAQLVDNNATKGKEALRFPMYVGDYLIKKGATLEEYYYWRDISEITDISKNSFNKMVDSFDFAYVNSQVGFSDIGNILKYGYEPAKLLTYLVKNSERRGMQWTINTLADYLSMCELMDVTPDKYPMDLQKQHDDMVLSFNGRNQYDHTLARIGIECEKYFASDTDDEDKIGRPKLFNDYIVIFPKCEKDFIEEGNMQHNCVGSYPRNVKRGSCVIFFIRNKSTPEKSFITGECTRSGLGQFLFSNNRNIDNTDLIALGKYVANKIKRGVSSGAIHALDKLI